MSKSTRNKLELVVSRWKSYVRGGKPEQFTDMSFALHALGEEFDRLKMSRLARLTEGLESITLKLMTDEVHPLSQQQINTINRQIQALYGAVCLMDENPVEKRTITDGEPEWAPRRVVHLLYESHSRDRAAKLALNIKQIGFEVEIKERNQLLESDQVRAVITIIDQVDDSTSILEHIRKVRAMYQYAQLFVVNTPDAIEFQVELLRHGADVLIHEKDSVHDLLTEILELTAVREAEPYKVLVVEDSKVASVIIQRTLKEHGIQSFPVRNPADILVALDEYHPDLILMDMQMPRFDGVEATRVVRQMRKWRSIPIIYLSGEQDIARQIEALRLGGDQFLTKPFNPIMLAAVVKTRVDRYRIAQRSTQIDGLTGLVTHSTGKQRLGLMLDTASEANPVAVVMVDIDHFKAINDSFGHPFGDQVICSLAWLMRGKLRSTDLIARYGGEEFLISLSGAGLETAYNVLENLRKLFNQLEHRYGEEIILSSFSAGLSVSYGGESADDVVKRADQALLEAKALGRNQIILSKSTKPD